jgi:hypothetical protein
MGFFDVFGSLTTQRIARQHELDDRAADARANLQAEERAFTLALRADRRAAYPKVLAALEHFGWAATSLLWALVETGGDGANATEHADKLMAAARSGEELTSGQEDLFDWIEKTAEAGNQLDAVWADASLVASDQVRLAYVEMSRAVLGLINAVHPEEGPEGADFARAQGDLEEVMRDNLTLGQ